MGVNMNKKLELMYGALLHDIGKIIYRSNSVEFEKGTHSKLGYLYLKQFDKFNKSSILESIRYHHYKELLAAKIEPDSPAYITYIADNIASGADRRDLPVEGDDAKLSFNKETPLSSIFNIIQTDYNPDKAIGTYSFGTSEYTKYPSDIQKVYTSSNYNQLKVDMTYDLTNKLTFGQEHFSSLLQWTESLWQYIPSSTNLKQITDISLYDHSKVTCALATCIYDYLDSKKITNYKEILFKNYEQTKAFYDENVFLLLSLDMSGIQDFIYNISGSKALKSLRSRSFYLEMMLEVIVDELLDTLNLSRANVLYTGGGHAYIILANTEETKLKLNQFENELKSWFLSNFSIDLSVAMAYESCSGYDFMNKDNRYKEVWKNLSQKLSDKKSHKYNIEDIMLINNTKSHGERECRECLRSDLELTSDGLCTVCDSIISISNRLRDKPFLMLNNKKGLKMPFDKYLEATDKQIVEKAIQNQDVFKIYSKNNPHISESMSTNIWMCDYDFSSLNEEDKKEGIASYAKRDIGIKRLGVVRADIDNLGKIFIAGIPETLNSISRTATLSRQLSMFFKHEITNILEGSKITVIYSGGDDLFMIGAWDEVIEKIIEIRLKFKDFTMDKLTFSAGIGMFKPTFPVSKMADMTGLLEERAKTGDKDQMSLWYIDEGDNYVFQWDDFNDYILNDKLLEIRRIFSNSEEHGKAFIYKMLKLLREDTKINIARLAYLIARSKLDSKSSEKIFNWAKSEIDKKDLIIALEYYIYEVREG
ncbi:type III-A CRISPR-associated protein Cas10/Csm1 [Macrococcus capreoli]